MPRNNRGSLIAVCVLTAYAVALFYCYQQTPAGLDNDVAEEGLRGIYLVAGRHLEVLTFAIGNSAETLYLYFVGMAIQLFGATRFAILTVSWTCALAAVWLVRKLVQRIAPEVPSWIPLLTAACSIWLFHYGRSGLRAISAPVFLGIFALLLDRSERGLGRKTELFCGAVLGLSVYAYTANRILPIAFLLYAGFQLCRNWRRKAALLRRYLTIGAGALAASIPNLVFFVQRRHDFLVRGSYVLKGQPVDMAWNALWSVLFPFYYPARYRVIVAPTFNFDTVCATFTRTGLSPVSWIFALAILAGLWQWKRCADKPVALFLAAAWLTSMLGLGITGPSLTRFLMIWPVYMALAALGFGYLAQRHTRAVWGVAALILFAGGMDGYRYFSTTPDHYGDALNPAATAIGMDARELGANGQRVLSVVSRDASVVAYLTYAETARERIVEFYKVPLDPAALPLTAFRPDTILIENCPAFQPFLAQVRPEFIIERNADFYSIRVPRAQVTGAGLQLR